MNAYSLSSRCRKHFVRPASLLAFTVGLLLHTAIAAEGNSMKVVDSPPAEYVADSSYPKTLVSIP